VKINLVKTAVGSFVCADDEAYEKVSNMKAGDVYEVTIKLNQNYRLHKKMFAFFKYCAQHYYGDEEVTQDQVEFTRSKLLMSSGYVKQVFYPDGKRFELYPASMKYEKMAPEERAECYKKLVTAACKRIFNNADERTWNKLIEFF
jgi:hypothetical protein